jgi:hypothetical protein
MPTTEPELGNRFTNRPTTNVVRPALLGAAVAFLVLAQSWPVITSLLYRLEMPIMEWGRLPYTIFYSGCIWLGLGCIALGDVERFNTVRKVIAVAVTAYVFSALAAATAFAWLDFAGRNMELRVPGPIENFFQLFSPFDSSSVGLRAVLNLWAVLTPGALIAGITLVAGLYRWNSIQPIRIESLPFLLLVATAGCAAFLLGSASAERLSYTISGEIDPADIGWTVLPVVALGSLGAWATLEWRRASTPPHPSSSTEAVNIEKTLSSASRTSILVLVLLYLGISHTSAYAKRMAELVEARKAFASDVLYAFFRKDETHFSKGGSSFRTDRTLTSTTLSAESSGLFLGVPWADVKVIQYPGDSQYVVEVTRKLPQEKWSVRQYHQPFDKGTETRQVADRYGITHDSTDDAMKLYPRIETQLRAADVSFPGSGISLDLTSFAFVVPVVVFATLVLFGHWLKELTRGYHAGAEIQWVLVAAKDGIVGLVARLWLIAIITGPWVLSIVFVEAVALTLRTKGTLNTLLLEGVSSLYVGMVLILLIISTNTAARTLIELRRLLQAQKRAPSPAIDT